MMIDDDAREHRPITVEQVEAEARALKEMMDSEGWRIFAKAQLDSARDLRLHSWNGIKTLDQLNYMKGFLAAVETVANYDKHVEVLLQQIEDAKRASDEDSI